MATPETAKKICPPVELPKCPHATEPPAPYIKLLRLLVFQVDLPCSEEYGLIITVTVGSGFAKRKFQVYEGLLKHYSDYFRAALSNRWPEGSLKTANLPDDGPDVFSAFFSWQYPSTVLHYIYENTSNQSPLRKFMVDYGYQKYAFDDIKTSPELWPREFLLDLIDTLRLHQEKLTYQITMPAETYIHTRKFEICSKYHDHSTSST